MTVPVVFMFVDESVSPQLDTASLTGVLVPADQLCDVRDEIYRLAVEVQKPPPNHVLAPIELHARTMLSQIPNATDADKLAVFERLVELVNAEKLQIISIGYTNWSELAFLAVHDEKLHGLNFSNILHSLGDLLSEALLVPVIDGLPGGTLHPKPSRKPIDPHVFRAFIASTHYNQSLRVSLSARNQGDMISIKGFRNIVEPVFSDSEHSPLLQLADVVSYLLHIVDWAERFEISGFKSSLLDVARKLDPSLIAKWRGRMNHSP